MEVMMNKMTVYIGLIEGKYTVSVGYWSGGVDSSLEVRLDDVNIITVIDTDTIECEDFMEVDGEYFNVKRELQRLYQHYVYGEVI